MGNYASEVEYIVINFRCNLGLRSRRKTSQDEAILMCSGTYSWIGLGFHNATQADCLPVAFHQSASATISIRVFDWNRK